MLITRAPVRISFGGGGTDLASYYTRFGGMVLSAAITRYCYVMVKDSADGANHISSADYHCWETYSPDTPPALTAPLALPKAALSCFLQRGWLKTGVELFLAAEVPPGTGLGSSSAMAVALISALAIHSERTLTAEEVAALACHLEIELLHMPIGRQDQYASALGGLNTLEFGVEGVQVTPLELPPDVVTSLNARLLLFSTNQARNSADILGQQRTHTEKHAQTQETLHRIKALAGEMRCALSAGELDHFGNLLDRAWQEKRQLTGRVSTQAIDRWYETARHAGALGGKITGAGGGGFLLFYCPLEFQQQVRDALTGTGLQELDFHFDFAGVQHSSMVWQSGHSPSLAYTGK